MILALVVAAGVDTVFANHTYRVGDKFFLQSSGAPIGLELAGAVHRPFMMRWDKKYLFAVRAAGITMHIFGRFVDDSNQVVEARNAEDSDEVIEAELLAIANSLVPGIEMESDLPSKHPDNKLPILDMKVWVDANGKVKHQHYEKPIASKNIVSQRSAHASASKKAIHENELQRRLLNTSRDLDWNSYFVPILTDYMVRMKKAGYSESYRRKVLKNALRQYDKKLQMANNGEVPLNRPSNYKKIERRVQKKVKKRSWGTKDNFIAPIIIPSTPNSELVRRLKTVMEKSNSKYKFTIVEKGGRTIQSTLINNNPLASGKRERSKFRKSRDDPLIPCRMCSDGSINCDKQNVNYVFKCTYDNCKGRYIGETSKSGFTRGNQHHQKYLQDVSTDPDAASSWMKEHQLRQHDGLPEKFKMEVVQVFKDSLSRQISEAVRIEHAIRDGFDVANDKSEWHSPSLVSVQSEVQTEIRRNIG